MDTRGRTRIFRGGVLALAMLALAGSSSLGEPEKPASNPAPAAAPQSAPTLDELLGLPAEPAKSQPRQAPAPGEKKPVAPAKPVSEHQADLDRMLTGKEMNDAFEEAVTLMGDASARLKDQRDAGLETQRVQEMVVKKLDQLLASMKKNQQSSSSSSSQSQQEPKPPPPPSRSQEQPQASRAANPENAQMGPTLQTGKLNGDLGSTQAAWGALPARIREMLLQGSSDRFSAKYQAMTEAYYRKLAQEKENK